MPVFFISSQNITDKKIIIEGPLFEHLIKSLRFREGDALVLCDEIRHRHHCHIQQVKKTFLEGTISNTELGPPESVAKIILGQAMLKGDHMTWAIQKATELGVSAIVPLLTERVVVRPNPDRLNSLHGRYARIALDAAQQSERWEIPKIFPPTPMHDFLGQFEQATIACILVEREPLPGIHSLPLDKGFQGTVVLMVGPEGGWTYEERHEAEHAHFTPISLGATILRGETAPLAALTILQSRLGNFG
jgi:16S rRNA (uracil1498-N3)-methyltransferase